MVTLEMLKVKYVLNFSAINIRGKISFLNFFCLEWNLVACASCCQSNLYQQTCTVAKISCCCFQNRHNVRNVGISSDS